MQNTAYIQIFNDLMRKDENKRSEREDMGKGRSSSFFFFDIGKNIDGRFALPLNTEHRESRNSIVSHFVSHER